MSVRARHFLRLNQLHVGGHCINLVNKDQAWCTFSPLLEHVTHTCCSTPTNISTKSDPLMLKKGTSASPATALARRVLPVPGGPTINTPLGIVPPILRNLFGSFKKSTISDTSSLASSHPATSLKRICSFSRVSIFCFAFTKIKGSFSCHS